MSSGSQSDQPKVHAISTPGELKCLSNSNQLVIAHTQEIVEELCACERRQVFTVYNRLAIKETTCYGYCRRYEYVITDTTRKDLIYLCHPTDCCACLQKFEIMTPPNVLIGTVTENFTICRPSFTIRSPDNAIQAKVVGPICPCCCCCCSSKSFKVFKDNRPIGRIGRGITGLDRKFPTSGYISVTYPKELDVKTKGLIMGAAVLVNFVYYYKCSTGKTFWIVNIAS